MVSPAKLGDAVEAPKANSICPAEKKLKVGKNGSLLLKAVKGVFMRT